MQDVDDVILKQRVLGKTTGGITLTLLVMLCGGGDSFLDSDDDDDELDESESDVDDDEDELEDELEDESESA